MRFPVDENLPAELAELLTDMGHDAIAVGSPLEGAADPLLWSLAAEENRVFITQDLDFPLNVSPTPPGLVLILFPDAFYVDTLISMTIDFIRNRPEDELLGRITVFAPGQTRVRDL